LGHEFVGEVVESDPSDWVGKRVVGEINVGCGVCEDCLKGLDRHCAHRKVLGIGGKDGVFAEYLALPVKNLVAVPDSVSDEEAVFVEPLASACEILEQVHIEPSHRVAVVGDGKLGQLIVRVLRMTGCRLTVIGRIEQKLKCFESLGVLTFKEDSPVDEKFDVVVEASGSPSGFSLALDLVKPRGVFILKSTTHEDIRFNPACIVIDEVQLVGSRCGRFEPAVRLLERGFVDVKSLISNIFPFDRALEAFGVAQDPKTLKVLLDFRR
jgi:alcohol dehydrogenase